MALLESIGETLVEGVGGTLLLGVGVLMVAPAIAPALRPVAKSAIKGGLVLTDKAKELFSESGEQWSDLMAEVKAERAASARGAREGEGTAIPVAKS